jgi:hypothetical protein
VLKVKRKVIKLPPLYMRDKLDALDVLFFFKQDSVLKIHVDQKRVNVCFILLGGFNRMEAL